MKVIAIAAVVGAASAASLRQTQEASACLFIDQTCQTQVPIVPGVIDTACTPLPMNVCTKSPVAALTWSFVLTNDNGVYTFTRYTDDACTIPEASVEGAAGACVGPIASMSGLQCYATISGGESLIPVDTLDNANDAVVESVVDATDLPVVDAVDPIVDTEELIFETAATELVPAATDIMTDGLVAETTSADEFIVPDVSEDVTVDELAGVTDLMPYVTDILTVDIDMIPPEETPVFPVVRRQIVETAVDDYLLDMPALETADALIPEPSVVYDVVATLA